MEEIQDDWPRWNWKKRGKKELKQKRIEKREIKIQMEKGSKSPNKKVGLKVQIEIGKSKWNVTKKRKVIPKTTM